MGARIRSSLIAVAFVAFWALLLRDFVNALTGPPIDWAPFVGLVAGLVPWVLSFAVLYALYRGWNRLVVKLRRLATVIRLMWWRGT